MEWTGECECVPPGMEPGVEGMLRDAPFSGTWPWHLQYQTSSSSGCWKGMILKVKRSPASDPAIIPELEGFSEVVHPQAGRGEEKKKR